MILRSSPGGRRREYHSGLLLVKVREGAGPSLARLSVRARAAAAPGVSVLQRLERNGQVKRITALARQASHVAGRPEVLRHLMAAHARTAPSDPNAGVHLVELAHDAQVEATRAALQSDEHVEFASRVPIRYLALPAAPSASARRRAGPPPASSMWNLRKIAWAAARGQKGFKDAQKVTVAVLDTGLDESHPDLKGRCAGYVYTHPDLPGAASARDLVGHGTHVAGTIAAIINNRVGINGICVCRLRSWKIFSDTPEFDPDQLAFIYVVDPVMYQRALADCASRGDIDVVNLSIGGSGRPDPQERALYRALAKAGVTVVAAMGNEREAGSPTSYPAAIPSVIAVGATSLDDTVAEFSNRGPHIALGAPGKAIWSTLPTYPGQVGFRAQADSRGRPVQGRPIKRKSRYDAWDGTSMSAPHVTAAVALLIANRGPLTPAAIDKALQASADKVQDMRGKAFSRDFGAGRLNLERLLARRR